MAQLCVSHDGRFRLLPGDTLLARRALVKSGSPRLWTGLCVIVGFSEDRGFIADCPLAIFRST